MSWADASLNEEPNEPLVGRINDLEVSVNAQLAELRNDLALALASIADVKQGSVAVDLEQQLERAVTMSLAKALETIRQSLVRSVEDAVQQLSDQLQTTDIDHIAASLQHSVLLALTSFEQSVLTPSSSSDGGEPPATARDLQNVSQRIDELKALLLG